MPELYISKLQPIIPRAVDFYTKLWLDRREMARTDGLLALNYGEKIHLVLMVESFSERKWRSCHTIELNLVDEFSGQ